jgi:hypothetical protein
MAENIVGIKIEVGGKEQVVTSMGEIRKILKDLQFEQLRLTEQFGAGSKQAIEAAKRIEDLKDRIADAKNMTEAFNPDAKFKAFSQSLQGVVGGFAAVQGAMAVFGVESEDLQKTLVKVQGALALSEGLNTFLDTGIQGFKNLISVIQNSTVVTKANDLATKAAAFTMKAFGIEVETTSVAFNVLKGAIISTGIGLLVVALGQAVSALDRYQNSAKEAADAQKELNKTIKEGSKFELDQLSQSLDNQMKVDIAKAKARDASEKEIFEIEQSYRRRKTQAQIRHYEDVKKIDQEAAKDALNTINKSNTEGIAAQYDYQTAEKKRRQEQAKQAKEAQEEAKRKLESDKQIILNIDSIQTIATEKERNNYKDLSKLKKQTIVLNTEIADSERLLARAKLEAQMEALGAVADSLAKASQLAEEGSGTQKALAISSAIISAILSAQKAYESTIGIPYVGPILAPINAGISLAAGYKSVQKIMSVPTPGNKGGSVGMPSGSFSSGAPVSPAPMQQTVTQLNQGTINALGNQAIKAYVLESDVTNSQNRVTRILNSSRFK